MSTFQYQGVDGRGRSVRGLIAADTVRAARDRLRETGVSVRNIEQRLERKSVNVLGLLRRRRYSGALTEFLRELTTLLQAAIPLLDAMRRP